MTNFFKKLFTQETHWTEYYIEQRKRLIPKIEELKKVYKELADKLTINLKNYDTK